MKTTNEIAVSGGADSPKLQPAQPTKTFSGPVSDYLWKELRGIGHCWVKRMGDPLSSGTLLPDEVAAKAEAQRNRWKLIAFAVPIAGVIALAGAKNGINAYQTRAARQELAVKEEALRRDQEAKTAVAVAETKAFGDAFANSDKSFVEFMAGAQRAPQYFATAADMAAPEAISGIRDSIASVLAGKPLDYVKPIATVGAWSAPVVFKQVEGGYLIGVAIDDAGVRKAVVLFASNGGTVGLRTYVPETEVGAFIADGDGKFKYAPLDKVRERLVRGFFMQSK